MSTPAAAEETTTTGEPAAATVQSKKDAAMKKSKIRHAAQLSESFKQTSKQPKDASQFVKYTRAMLDFAIMSLVAERAMLDELVEMSDDEKLETLFELLDKDGDGAVDATELADGLRKIRGNVSFQESLVLAIDRIATFDKEGSGKLNKEDFKTMAEALAEALGTTFHEVSEMMVMAVLFSKTGNTLEENIAGVIVSADVTEAVKEEEEARKIMVDKRMKALFALFDTDGSGAVDFKEVVMGMYRLSQDLKDSSKAAMVALLMFDEDHSRNLNYEQFAKFIINILAASPDHIEFDDVADAMTKAASEPVTMTTDELLSVLMLQETMEEALDLQDAVQQHNDQIAKSQLARCKKLFLLWDLDNDGAVSLDELILGLRKFEEASSLSTTVDEAVALMEAFDLDQDQKLNLKEFVVFLVQFANLAATDLDEMLDFMIVTAALKENDEAELKFLKALAEGDVYSMG
ncbi:hypothetical protein ACA910_020202 [Epithemia clementina (nom. ined.)]